MQEIACSLTLGDWVRLQREQLGLRQADLARLLGVNPARISDWEQGSQMPALEMVRQLAEALEHAAKVTESTQEALTPQMHIWVDDRGIAWIEDTNTKVKEVVLEHVTGHLPPEEIQREHPHLSLAQIHAALAYYFDHQPLLDAQIEQDMRYVESLRQHAGESPFVKRMRAEGRLR